MGNNAQSRFDLMIVYKIDTIRKSNIPAETKAERNITPVVHV